MARNALCKYGNCSSYETDFSVNGSGYRDRFCSWLHASLGALRHATTAEYENQYAVELMRRATALLEEADEAIRHKRTGPKEVA